MRKKELKVSRRNITELEADLSKWKKGITNRGIENNVKSSNQDHDKSAPFVIPTTASCDSGIDMNIDSLKKQIVSEIDSMINSKINEKLSYKPSVKEPVGNPCDSKKIVTNKRNISPCEREENIIIHGLVEDKGDKSDEKKVKDIFEAIDVCSNPVTILRLGPKAI